MNVVVPVVGFALIALGSLMWAIGAWAPADALMPIAVVIAVNSALSIADRFE